MTINIYAKDFPVAKEEFLKLLGKEALDFQSACLSFDFNKVETPIKNVEDFLVTLHGVHDGAPAIVKVSIMPVGYNGTDFGSLKEILEAAGFTIHSKYLKPDKNNQVHIILVA